MATVIRQMLYAFPDMPPEVAYVIGEDRNGFLYAHVGQASLHIGPESVRRGTSAAMVLGTGYARQLRYVKRDYDDGIIKSYPSAQKMYERLLAYSTVLGYETFETTEEEVQGFTGLLVHMSQAKS
ncbi:MAG TPA: hypothetical protein VI979_02930 [archaeon]|nr:hypothetical protein [archaeon]